MTLITFLWLVGYALFFVGERMFGTGGETWRWVLDGGGLVAILAALGMLAAARGKAEPEQRGPYILGLAFGGVGLLSLVFYGLSTAKVTDALSFEGDTLLRYQVVLGALVPIAWLAGTLPLLSITRALGMSPVRSIPKLIREGALSALAVSFALSMLFPLNYLASQYNKRWDLGYFKTAQAGSRTQAMVDSLEEPLRVVCFFPTGSDVGAEVKAYFDGIEGNKLDVEYVDHALEPGLAEELKVRDNGYVAFVKGEQIERVKVGSDFESARRKLKDLDSEMQKSLAKLARGQKVAYFTTGHGEEYWRGGEDKDHNINTLKQLLTGLNYKVKELGLPEGLGVTVPDDASVVFVMGPTEPFLDEELASLDAYRRHGGALLVSLEPSGPDLSGVLAPIGLSVDTAHPLVIDNYFLKVTGGPGDQLNQVTNRFSSHPSVTTLSRNSKAAAVAFPGAVAIDQDKSPPGKVQVTIRSLASAWKDLNGDLAFNDGAESRQQYSLAVAATGPAEGGGEAAAPTDNTPKSADADADAKDADAKDPSKDHGKDRDKADDKSPSNEYRVVVMGDSQWASDLFLLYSGNGQLAVDTLAWLTEDDALSGETESEEDVKIQHTKEGQGLWFYGAAVFVPFGMLGLGLARLKLRRRRGGKV